MADRKEYHRKRRADRAADGKCTRCPQAVEPGRKTCAQCVAVTNANRAARKLRQAA